jgi:hypothetical protein
MSSNDFLVCLEAPDRYAVCQCGRISRGMAGCFTYAPPELSEPAMTNTLLFAMVVKLTIVVDVCLRNARSEIRSACALSLLQGSSQILYSDVRRLMSSATRMGRSSSRFRLNHEKNRWGRGDLISDYNVSLLSKHPTPQSSHKVAGLR